MTLANTTRQNNLWSCRSLSAAFCLCTLSTFLFTACGDDGTTENVTNITQMGVEVVASVEDLPKCEKDNQGEQALVKGESSVRVCVDGKWFVTKESTKDTVYVEDGDFSCTTKELKDKSGLKIVCNGDSIGVVLNGEKGADGTNGTNGDDGAGCAVVEQTDSTVVINCGGQKMTLNLGAATVLDSLGVDSEQIAISLDTLAGVSQKGPFLKGSTVYLYELSDGRTLKQTNGNFVSNITSDDGRFRFTTRDLMSQYALIMVDGKYRNEVTGKPTNTSIRLQAYTDVLSRKNANVNVLTELEKNRVYYLVTREKKRFKVAKHQAQMEILDAFHIDTTIINKSSEDLNVFGNTDADAALLAISILLQGDGDETALSVLLTEIADDMESDGKWDDSQARAELVDWAMVMDAQRMLAKFRSNVESWNLSPAVPQFEKFIRNFWVNEKYGACKAENEGELVEVDYHQKWSTIVRCTQGEWSIRSLYDERDGQYYQVVKIGNQTWMAENLNYAAEGSYCYADSAVYCDKYGRLYNWATAVGVAADAECVDWGVSCELPDVNQGACPNGWHVATAGEWNTLIKTVAELLGTTDQKTTPLMAKGFDCWPNATNDFSFNLLPAGRRYGDEKYTDYHYDNVLNGAYMWTGSEDSYYTDCPSHVSCPPVAYGVMGYGFNSNSNYIGYGTSTNLMDYYSVRCVQDAPAAP